MSAKSRPSRHAQRRPAMKSRPTGVNRVLPAKRPLANRSKSNPTGSEQSSVAAASNDQELRIRLVANPFFGRQNHKFNRFRFCLTVAAKADLEQELQTLKREGSGFSQGFDYEDYSDEHGQYYILYLEQKELIESLGTKLFKKRTIKSNIENNRVSIEDLMMHAQRFEEKNPHFLD